MYFHKVRYVIHLNLMLGYNGYFWILRKTDHLFVRDDKSHLVKFGSTNFQPTNLYAKKYWAQSGQTLGSVTSRFIFICAVRHKKKRQKKLLFPPKNGRKVDSKSGSSFLLLGHLCWEQAGFCGDSNSGSILEDSETCEGCKVSLRLFFLKCRINLKF